MKDRRYRLLVGAVISLCAALAGFALVQFLFGRESSSPPIHPEAAAVQAERKAGASASGQPDSGPDGTGPFPRSAKLSHEGATDFATELATLKTADGEQLLAYYRRGVAASATMEERFMAMEVIQACTGYANQKTSMREALASMSFVPREHPIRSIVDQRREVLAHRCAPLDSIGAADWLKTTLRLTAELTAPDSSFRPIRLRSESGEPIKGEELEQARLQMRNQLDRYGSAALYWTAADLLELAEIDKDRPGRMDFGNEQGAWTVTDVAFAIAPCLANQPCDSNSLYTLGMCVGSGGTDCEESIEASLLAHLPDAASKTRARKLANEIVAVIGARDWQRLGL